MACGGPNLDYARQQGNQFADRLIAEMAQKHDIKEPDSPSMKSDYHQNVTKLREAIVELFVIEACDSW